MNRFIIVLFIRYCQDDQSKEDVARIEEKKNRDVLIGDPGVDGG
jgi:hypothetical protein